MNISARLSEFSDLELLGVVHDCLDERGTCGTADVLAALFPGRAQPMEVLYQKRSVGIRLSWMRRYGLVDRDERAGRWRPTPIGTALFRGTLSRNQVSLVEALPPEKLPALMARVSLRYRGAEPSVGHVIRREWQHGSGRR